MKSFVTRQGPSDEIDPRFQVTDIRFIKTTANIPKIYGEFMTHNFDSSGNVTGNMSHRGLHQDEVNRLRNDALGRFEASIEANEDGMQ